MNTENIGPKPKQLSAAVRTIRTAYTICAWAFATGVVFQVFFAGLGVLVDPRYFGWHTTFAHLLALTLLVMLVLGVIGRVGWKIVGLNVLQFLLFTMQYYFMYGLQGPLRALHLVNALALFWIAVHLGQRSWHLSRHAQQQAAARAFEGPISPDDTARTAGGTLPKTSRQTLSPTRVLAGAVLIILGAVVLLGIIFDNGPGFPTVDLPDQQPVQGERESDPQPSGAEPSPEVGAQIFAQRCSGCHGGNGQGGFGPALAGNQRLEDTSFVTKRILSGRGGMPAWRDRLSDEQIAAVATHIRTSWGNDYGPVVPNEVATQR